MLNMKGFLKLVPYVLYVQGCGEISELSMMMAGVVLIQHPLHLLLLKVALAGLLSVQHWADGRIGFCRALHQPTAVAVYRYASSFQPSAKDLVMARDSSLDDAAALEKTKIRALNPHHAWWNGQVTPSQSQVPLRQMQKTIFFWIYLSFGISTPRVPRDDVMGSSVNGIEFRIDREKLIEGLSHSARTRWYVFESSKIIFEKFNACET